MVELDIKRYHSVNGEDLAMAATANTKTRRGLVIAGGGALGAYSFGCLKAFAEAGLSFQVVAGTSAGSLNAAIWSTGQLALGERLWSTMSPENTYDVVAPLKRLPHFLRQPLIVAILFFGALAARARGQSVEPRFNNLLTITVCALFAAALYGVWRLTGAEFPGSIVAGAASIFAFIQLKRGMNNAMMLPTIMATLFLVLLPAIPWLSSANLHRLIELPLIMGIIIGSAMVGTFIYVAIDTTLKILEQAAFSSKGLEATVQGFLDRAPMKIATYVTAATARALFDPDRPRYSDLASAPGEAPLNPQPLLTNYWVPTYVRVDKMASAEAIAPLMASAALPFGIVPAIETTEGFFVDGGVVDNCPILPLTLFELDEIFVLTLGGGELDSETERRRCAELGRLIALAQRGAPKGVPSLEENDPPTIVPYPEFPGWPKLQTFAPSGPLGGPLALMNFDPAFGRQLIDRGYTETQAALVLLLRQGGIEPPTATVNWPPVDNRTPF
jgi:predicted acylesterase/phospholipase RssA